MTKMNAPTADASFCALFERAVQLRDADAYDAALVVAKEAFASATSDRQRCIAARELGYELELAGRVDASVGWFRRACRFGPRSWLASLSYFQLLLEAGRPRHAFDEAARFAATRHSKEYRGLFEAAFADDVPSAWRERADVVRARLRGWGVPWTDAHRQAWDALPDRAAWDGLPDPSALLAWPGTVSTLTTFGAP